MPLWQRPEVQKVPRPLRALFVLAVDPDRSGTYLGSTRQADPPPPPISVTLRPITAATVRAVCALTVQPHQERFVAPNAVSLAQALFEPTAWYRAICADETLVGFVMVDDDVANQAYSLWRFMVAGEHQGRGFGRRTLELVLEYVRTRPGATELLVSYVPGEGSPRDFYSRFGFVETGEVDDDGLEKRTHPADFARGISALQGAICPHTPTPHQEVEHPDRSPP